MVTTVARAGVDTVSVLLVDVVVSKPSMRSTT